MSINYMLAKNSRAKLCDSRKRYARMLRPTKPHKLARQKITKLRAELSCDYRDVANRAMGLNHAKKQTSIIKVGNQAMRLHLLTLLAKTSKTLSSNQHRNAASNKKPELDKQLSASRQREAKHRASRPPSLSAVAPQNTQARTTHPSKSTHITDVISAARAHATDVIDVMSAILLADHAFLRL